MAGNIFSGDLSYLLVLVGALFVHMSYQLSVSVLTYMSSHSLSRKTSAKRLLMLGSFYTLGTIVMSALILTAIVSLISLHGSTGRSEAITQLTMLAVAFAPIIGLITLVTYYRKGPGTKLWLPRPLAEYLLIRARKAKSAAESFALGMATVVGELPFLIAPLLLVALAIVHQPTHAWLTWSSLYSLLAAFPLLIIVMYLSSGHSIARVQRWREQNKNFLRWTSGLALVLLTGYITVLQLGVF